MFSNKLEVNRADFEQERKDRQEAAGRYEAKEEEFMEKIQKLTEENLSQANEVERTFYMRTLCGFTTCTRNYRCNDLVAHTLCAHACVCVCVCA